MHVWCYPIVNRLVIDNYSSSTCLAYTGYSFAQSSLVHLQNFILSYMWYQGKVFNWLVLLQQLLSIVCTYILCMHVTNSGHVLYIHITCIIGTAIYWSISPFGIYTLAALSYHKGNQQLLFQKR